MNNIFAVYKPVGPTSNDFLEEIRLRTGVKKVGHAGTLDPLASGVLVVGLGREATKTLSAVVAKEKEYLATIRLGQTSTTDDAEGQKSEVSSARFLPVEQVAKALEKFTGQIEQTPPVFSAVKVNGKEAYKYARQGQPVSLKPRMVEIKKIDLITYNGLDLIIRVTTGPGVYIRSLARDIGQELGAGAYLAGLERTRVGEFKKEHCVTVDQLVKNLSA